MISWQIHSQCDFNGGIRCSLFSQCVIVQRGALSRQEVGLRLQQVTDGPHALWQGSVGVSVPAWTISLDGRC